jgi:hypothetical protein
MKASSRRFSILAFSSAISIALILAGRGVFAFTATGNPWLSHAGNAQHTGQSLNSAQSLKKIHWQAPVDLRPQYNGGELLIHYGSPLVTANNTVIIPVKTGLTSGFQVDARDGATGHLIWSIPSDYILPTHNWTPEFGPVLTSSRVYFPGVGGTVMYRDSPDSATGTQGRIAFYGNSNSTNFKNHVEINTPLSADSAGNIYFGFVVNGNAPLNLQSGIARISSTGVGSWVSVTSASSDSKMTKVVHNCAPAVSADGKTIYVAVSNGSAGYLLALNSTSLATTDKVRLKDPKSGQDAWLSDDGSATPTVGPDGDVYYGVLESPFPSNNDRGWLLHFNSTLTVSKTPGAFGWDDTASVVPLTMVPSYSAAVGSTYLLMTKYNNYTGIGTGNGQNKIAVLDPNGTETDPITGATVMKEVITMLGQTPDGSGGFKEWCINTAAVDPASYSVFAGSEDGKLYRWNLMSNSLTEVMTLTAGLGEAYTPTVIGADGTVYAINNAILFAIGN